MWGFEEECPCIFSEVPPVTECWPAPPPDSRTPSYFTVGTQCDLVQVLNFPTTPSIVSSLSTIPGTNQCRIEMGSSLPSVCREANKDESFLTDGQMDACECKLEQYVKELIKLGFTVWDSDENPLKPEDVFCPGE